MQEIKLVLQEKTLNEKLLSLIKQCKFKNLLKQIHTQMLICSIPKPSFLLSKIIDLKDLSYASLVFNQLTKPNIYAFNVMLRGLTTTWKKYDFCVELDLKLKSLGLKANNFTYPFLDYMWVNYHMVQWHITTKKNLIKSVDSSLWTGYS